MVWHFAYSGAVLNTSSSEIFTGNRLITNYLGLIFTGSLGTLVFSVSESVDLLYNQSKLITPYNRVIQYTMLDFSLIITNTYI